jgi:hypothetical protein
MRRHRHFVPRNPMQRLIEEAEKASRYAFLTSARHVARSEADRIPETFEEKLHTEKGGIARQARAIMRRLPDMTREEVTAEAATLGEMANALAGGRAARAPDASANRAGVKT